MLQVIRNLLLILLFSISSLAMDCQLAKSLNHPSLVNNAEFWEKLGKIKPTDDRAIKNLINTHAPEALSVTNSAARITAASTKEVFSINSKAEKARNKLSKKNQQHFDEFIQVLTEKGPQGLYEQPKRWHYERLTSNRELHTVRLDGGNRVLFKIQDGVAHIIDVGNHITH